MPGFLVMADSAVSCSVLHLLSREVMVLPITVETVNGNLSR
jgi:hypothetical protein